MSPPFTLSKTDRARLARIFLRVVAPGGKAFQVGDNITTPRAALKDLHALMRKGLITYEEAVEYKKVFGVLAWKIELTAAGKIAMKEVCS